MEPKSPSKLKLCNLSDLNKRKLKFAGVIAVALLLLCALYTAFKLIEDQDSNSYFTIVLDCGSTGTRVSVYEWLSRDVNPGELPILRKSYPDSSAINEFRKGSCQYHCLQTQPGLDKFIGNASGVRKSLEPLIKLAKQWVPIEKQKDTPIYVLATAGLRRVGEEDAGRVLDDVEAVLKDHEFFHRRLSIRVLSGKEEAYYGWVALNYKMGRLGNSSKLPTLGLLDLGGSSLQAAVEGRKEVNSNQKVSLRDTSIRNQDQVLSYSLEAFGLNAAFDRTVVMLSQELDDVSDGYKLKHPCLISSYVQNYTCYDCLKVNLTDRKNSNQNAEPILVHMVGEPNWGDCIRLAKAVATTNISISFPYSPSESPNSKVDSPSQTGGDSDTLPSLALAVPDASFHALSGFFAIQSKLKLSPRANSIEALEKGQKLCSKLWTNSSHSSKIRYYGDQFCFQVPYMVSLIDDVFHLGNKMVTFGPADISWTLGAALSEGEFIWLSPDKKNVVFIRSREFFSSPLLLFMLLVCLGLIVYCSQIKFPMPAKSRGSTRASLPSYTRPRHHL